MTTGETTGGTEMETEQKTNTVIGDIENQNTVTMTQAAYDAIKEQHEQVLAARDQRIQHLTLEVGNVRARTIDFMIEECVANSMPDIGEEIDDYMNNHAGDYIECWANDYLDGFIESWAQYNLDNHIDYCDITDQVVSNIDFYGEFHNALQGMCDNGKNSVAALVNELIEQNKIKLPATEHNKFGPQQQAIYTALDQIRGGITTILAQMDANPPEVTE
tara:strand:+ start:2137 stop:2790 length:654 start_codon:yes stop_codon:yes gene_type:complete